MWRGRLFLAPGLVLYLGEGGEAKSHAHHAVQLVWAKEARVEVRIAGQPIDVRATLIPARVEHSFNTSASELVLMLVDGHGARGVELDARANALRGMDVSKQLARVGFPAPELTVERAQAWCRSALAALGVEASDTQAPSRPTRRAIAYIEEALEGVPRLSEAAKCASTSESRLSHRFTEEIGLPFRRFVLWMRIKRAVEVSRRGGDLTQAAAAAGFSDAAHLSRTFRAMFGLSPSLVLPFVEVMGQQWTR